MARLDSANRDQRLLQAGVLALLVHVGFFIFMTFGLKWNNSNGDLRSATTENFDVEGGMEWGANQAQEYDKRTAKKLT